MYRIWGVSVWAFAIQVSFVIVDLIQGQKLASSLLDSSLAVLAVAMLTHMLKAWAANPAVSFNLGLSSSVMTSGALGMWMLSCLVSYFQAGDVADLQVSGMLIVVLYFHIRLVVPVNYKKSKYKNFISFCSIPLGIGLLYGTIVGYQNRRFSWQK